jgi:eukaryotic-like serine/threonine-protein kinase
VHLRPLIVPLVIATSLTGIGIFTQRISREAFERQVEQQLITVLNADVEAMEVWVDAHQRNARFLAGRTPVRRAAAELVTRAQRRSLSPEQLLSDPAARDLATQVQPFARAEGYVSYFLIDRAPRLLAGNPPELIGRPLRADALDYVRRVLAGETIVTRPMPPDSSTGRGSDTAYIYVAAPVQAANGDRIATLALGIDPSMEFSRILEVARFGETGETYAFDQTGLMISESRFRDDLAKIGLLQQGQSAVVNVEIRDPGGNMVEGFRPTTPRRAQPLTFMAASATALATNGDTSTYVNLKGYNDYRGVPVIGAWKWLPEYGFGITTEVDVGEAYRVPALIGRLQWGVFALLVAAAFAVVVVNLLNQRLQSRVLEARQLGQYKLEKKIGEGGMGAVYRARHALLRRPTAVKLLLPEKATKQAITRFEREVRHTAKLSNPNTVSIFDYGRTPDGIFYYAMEYLPGVNLSQLVEQQGPLSPARVLHILKQAAASLAEAHDIGLIHRDIKPSNIMLCERGGVFDFVKVLDFGLVRETNQQDTMQLTAVDSLTGTPLYVSPEAIEDPTSVDPRTDLYALGAVAYYMLVGDHVFTGSTVLEVCGHHLNTPAPLPSHKMSAALDAEFESLIARLLAKNREDRPANARELLHELNTLGGVGQWSQDDARTWWEANAIRRESRGAWHVDFAGSGTTPTGAGRGTSRPRLMVDLDHRMTSDAASMPSRPPKDR